MGNAPPLFRTPWVNHGTPAKASAQQLMHALAKFNANITEFASKELKAFRKDPSQPLPLGTEEVWEAVSQFVNAEEAAVHDVLASGKVPNVPPFMVKGNLGCDSARAMADVLLKYLREPHDSTDPAKDPYSVLSSFVTLCNDVRQMADAAESKKFVPTAFSHPFVQICQSCVSMLARMKKALDTLHASYRKLLLDSSDAEETVDTVLKQFHAAEKAYGSAQDRLAELIGRMTIHPGHPLHHVMKRLSGSRPRKVPLFGTVVAGVPVRPLKRRHE